MGGKKKYAIGLLRMFLQGFATLPKAQQGPLLLLQHHSLIKNALLVCRTDNEVSEAIPLLTHTLQPNPSCLRPLSDGRTSASRSNCSAGNLSANLR